MTERGARLVEDTRLDQGVFARARQPWLTALITDTARGGARRCRAVRKPELQRIPAQAHSATERAAPGMCGRGVRGVAVDPLRPTGQRHALATATLIFVVLTIAARALSSPPSLFGLFVCAAIVCGFGWAFRRFVRPAGRTNPATPGFLLNFPGWCGHLPPRFTPTASSPAPSPHGLPRGHRSPRHFGHASRPL